MKIKHLGLPAVILLMSVVFSACQVTPVNTEQVMEKEVMNESKDMVQNPREVKKDLLAVSS